MVADLLAAVVLDQRSLFGDAVVDDQLGRVVVGAWVILLLVVFCQVAKGLGVFLLPVPLSVTPWLLPKTNKSFLLAAP